MQFIAALERPATYPNPHAIMKTHHSMLLVPFIAAMLSGTASAHSGNHGTTSADSGFVHFFTHPNQSSLVIIPILIAFAWFCHCKARSQSHN